MSGEKLSFKKKEANRWEVLGAKNTPLRVKLQCRDDMIIIYVNAREYAVIDNIRPSDDIDLRKLSQWVDETYNQADHESSQYIPCRLHKRNFLPKETT